MCSAHKKAFTVLHILALSVALTAAADESWISSIIIILSRPKSIMLKSLPKMLPGISPNFHLLCFSVFLLCLHYTPKLPKILSIVMKFKVMTALLKYFITK